MGNIEDLNSITSDFDNEVPVNASVITSGLTDAERVNLRACLIATEGPFPQLGGHCHWPLQWEVLQSFGQRSPEQYFVAGMRKSAKIPPWNFWTCQWFSVISFAGAKT